MADVVGGVFLSYRRDDSAHFTSRLGEHLEREIPGVEVFLDVARNDGHLGRDIDLPVQEALDRCSVLLAVIGKSWLDAPHADGRRRLDDPTDLLVHEIRTALERGMTVIPVLADGASMPRPEDMPASLTALARKTWITVRNDRFAADVGPLITRLLVEVRPAVRPVSRGSGTHPAGRTWSHDRRRDLDRDFSYGNWIALACVLTAIAVGLWFWQAQVSPTGWITIPALVVSLVALGASAVPMRQLVLRVEQRVIRDLVIGPDGITATFLAPWGKISSLELTEERVLLFVPIGKRWLPRLPDQNLVRPEGSRRLDGTTEPVSTPHQRRPPYRDEMDCVAICDLRLFDAPAADVVEEIDKYMTRVTTGRGLPVKWRRTDRG